MGAPEVHIANETSLLPSSVGDHTGEFLEGGAATYTAAEFEAQEMTYKEIKDEEDYGDVESLLEKGEVKMNTTASSILQRGRGEYDVHNQRIIKEAHHHHHRLGVAV